MLSLGEADILDDADLHIQKTLQRHAEREKKKEEKRERKALRKALMTSGLDADTPSSDASRPTRNVQQKKDGDEEKILSREEKQTQEEEDEEELKNQKMSRGVIAFQQGEKEEREEHGAKRRDEETNKEEETGQLKKNSAKELVRHGSQDDELLKFLLFDDTDDDDDDGHGFVGLGKGKKKKAQDKEHDEEEQQQESDGEFDEDLLLSEIERDLEELLAEEDQGEEEQEIHRGEQSRKVKADEEVVAWRDLREEEERENSKSEEEKEKANNRDKARQDISRHDSSTGLPSPASASSSSLSPSVSSSHSFVRSPCSSNLPSTSSSFFSLNYRAAAQRARQAAASLAGIPLPSCTEWGSEQEGGEQEVSEEQEKRVDKEERGETRKKEDTEAHSPRSRERKESQEELPKIARRIPHPSGETKREVELGMDLSSQKGNTDTKGKKDKGDNCQQTESDRRKERREDVTLRSGVDDDGVYTPGKRKRERTDFSEKDASSNSGSTLAQSPSSRSSPSTYSRGSSSFSSSKVSPCARSTGTPAAFSSSSPSFPLSSPEHSLCSLSSRPALVAIDPKERPITVSRTDRVIRETILSAARRSKKGEGEKRSTKGGKNKNLAPGDEANAEEIEAMLGEGKSGSRPLPESLEDENKRVAEANQRAENEARMFTRRCGVLGLHLPQRPVRTLEELWRLQNSQQSRETGYEGDQLRHRKAQEDDKDQDDSTKTKKDKRKEGQLKESDGEDGGELPIPAVGRRRHISPHRVLMEAARRVHERGVFDHLVGTVEGEDEAAKNRTARVLRASGVTGGKQRRRDTGEQG